MGAPTASEFFSNRPPFRGVATNTSMRFKMFLLIRCLILSAGLAPGFEALRAQPMSAGRPPSRTLEWRTELASAGSSDIAEGSRALGSIRHTYAAADFSRFVPMDDKSSLRFGLGWRRFAFSGSRADVPDRLDSIALKLGYTRNLSPQWSLQADVAPGIYSDFSDIGRGDLNVPGGLRLMSFVSPDLQWGLALLIDPRRPSPVMGGPGVRWQFAPRWTLIGFPPEPRVEFAVTQALAIFAGAGLRSGTFRVAEDFGRQRGRPELDDQLVDFREIAVGVGARWRTKPGFTVNAGINWMLDRRFEYEARNLLLNGDGAIGLVLSLSGSR